MVDIHIHILPGMDDGSADINESLEMAQLAVESGVTHMAVTPHSYADEDFFADSYDEAFNYFKNELEKNDINLKIYPGMEILSFPGMGELLRQGKLKTINNTRYALMEFNFNEDKWLMEKYTEEVKDAGFIPVIAHLERYQTVQKELRFAYELLEKGCVIQMNKGSIKGRFGKHAMKAAWELLNCNLVHVIASDAHSSEFRTPYMADVADIISEEFSPEHAELYMNENPMRILQGRAVDGFEPREPRGKRGWFN